MSHICTGDSSVNQHLAQKQKAWGGGYPTLTAVRKVHPESLAQSPSMLGDVLQPKSASPLCPTYGLAASSCLLLQPRQRPTLPSKDEIKDSFSCKDWL